ncbi:unnamed protein product [Nesidiocoris tenuis]|uniref:Deoxyribonuclease TATDN1 n=1 Tax=Nesidiocoris tenuis TaxID=355587 RepID=A0A6H5G4L7_9HEMI|nr:unnamed protein product [Nesidiocoris tenuis]
MYQGVYHGSTRHAPDLDRVLLRSWDSGIEKIIITGASLTASKFAIEMANTDEEVYCTVGCHPTHASEFEDESLNKGSPDDYLNALESLIVSNPEKVVALGECGLDYDRLQFCPKETQLKYFKKQLELAQKLKIPVFLHCRAAFDDFYRLVTEYPVSGVVHSFDGTLENAKSFIDLGLDIGINGCSLKTEQNLSVVKEIPSKSLHLETDCPYCDIRPTHAGFKHVKTKFETSKKWRPNALLKGRNEPCTIAQVLEVMAAIRNEDEVTLCDQIFNNTLRLFFSKK